MSDRGPTGHWRTFGDGWDEPKPLRKSLERLAGRLGAPAPAAVAALFGRWPDVVGPDAGAHCAPQSLRDGVLIVAADDPAWAASLRYLGDTLVTRLEEAVGTGVVKRVEVRVVRPS